MRFSQRLGICVKNRPGLLSHRADLLRSYLAAHTQHADIALQLTLAKYIAETFHRLLISEIHTLIFSCASIIMGPMQDSCCDVRRIVIVSCAYILISFLVPCMFSQAPRAKCRPRPAAAGILLRLPDRSDFRCG